MSKRDSFSFTVQHGRYVAQDPRGRMLIVTVDEFEAMRTGTPQEKSEIEIGWRRILDAAMPGLIPSTDSAMTNHLFDR